MATCPQWTTCKSRRARTHDGPKRPSKDISKSGPQKVPGYPHMAPRHPRAPLGNQGTLKNAPMGIHYSPKNVPRGIQEDSSARPPPASSISSSSSSYVSSCSIVPYQSMLSSFPESAPKRPEDTHLETLPRNPGTVAGWAEYPATCCASVSACSADARSRRCFGPGSRRRRRRRRR
eukprot:7023375-Pyramimonas_sp.AAC.1